jgi:lipopolysaccharide transport system permease protein
MNTDMAEQRISPAAEAPESSWTRISENGQSLSIAAIEFWRAKELMWLLIQRHLKIRFAQTAMGAMWAILQPLMTATIFSVLFGVFVKVPSEGIPYVAYAYPAMVIWSLFAQAFDRGSTSLMAEERLITKVYFSRLIIPFAASLSTLADFIISMLLLIPLSIVFGIKPHLSIFASIIAIPPVLLLATSLGILTASLSVRYRDLRQVAPFITQLWFYATPVVYPLTVVPDFLRTAVLLNPVSAPVLWFRAAFMGTTFPPWWSISGSYATALLVFAFSVQVFRSVERGMADWL